MEQHDSDFIKNYLSRIDSKAFLSKDEQIRIGFEIKKNEQLIIETCIGSIDFRKQILSLKVDIDRNADNIVKFSKLIEETSSKPEIALIGDHFNDLFEVLVSGSDKQCLKFLNKIQLTSSTINKLLTPIKARAYEIVEQQDRYLKILKFLEADSVEELRALINDCKDNTYRNVTCKKLYINESRLNHYLSDAGSVVTFLEDNNIIEGQVHDLIQLSNKIKSLESQVQEKRDLLIKSNLALVVARAKRFMNQGLDFDDLVQEGNIGLIKAVDKYEPSKNIKVTTYAAWWIDQSIRRAISNKAKVIRIPIHIQDILYKVNKAYHQLSHELKREPTIPEIANKTLIRVEVLNDLVFTAQHRIGIDDEITTGVTYSDIIPDQSSFTPFTQTSRSMLKDRIRLILRELNPRNEKIIRLRFGIGEDQNHTLEEIGGKLRLSKQRVRQLETDCVTQLKSKYKLGDLDEEV